jgi:hypothetical protein
MLAMRNVRPTDPPVVRVSARAQAELGAGQALVFDWTRLALCCAVAGEVSLRRTTTSEVQGAPAFVPLRTADGGPPVFAHRRAYPLLVGRRVEIDCRRRLGIRSFTSSLPPDLGLRASFGRAASPLPDDRNQLGTPSPGPDRQPTGGSP